MFLEGDGDARGPETVVVPDRDRHFRFLRSPPWSRLEPQGGGQADHMTPTGSATRRPLGPGSLGEVSAQPDVQDLSITDEELTELALAADPDAPLPEDAVPIGVHLSSSTPLRCRSGTCPPQSDVGRTVAPSHRGGGGSAFFLIDALGLCNTYGILSFA